MECQKTNTAKSITINPRGHKMKNSEFDHKDFRRALGQFPTGVTVVSTLDESEKPICVTASSFNAVSINPPLILWSVDKRGSSLPIWEKAKHFAINVLGKDQVDVSNRFAGHGEDKYKDISFSQGIGGSPLLDGCAAQFECKTWNVYEGGDHIIMIGEVLNYCHNDGTYPLIFSRGSYAVTSEHPSSMQRDQPDYERNGFLSNFLLNMLRRAFNGYSSQLAAQFMGQFDIVFEEWGVLALLSHDESISASQMANLIMQPETVFNATAGSLADKGFLEFDRAADQIKLTNSGHELADKLFLAATQHESAVLSALTDEEAQQFKSSMAKVLETLP